MQQQLLCCCIACRLVYSICCIAVSVLSSLPSCGVPVAPGAPYVSWLCIILKCTKSFVCGICSHASLGYLTRGISHHRQDISPRGMSQMRGGDIQAAGYLNCRKDISQSRYPIAGEISHVVRHLGHPVRYLN